MKIKGGSSSSKLRIERKTHVVLYFDFDAKLTECFNCGIQKS